MMRNCIGCGKEAASDVPTTSYRYGQPVYYEDGRRTRITPVHPACLLLLKQKEVRRNG